MASKKKEKPGVRLLKAVVFVNALVPLALLIWDWQHDRLGVNPVEFITRTTGTLTLVFLMLTLAVTPARRLFDAPIIGRLRRELGLFAFFYASLHFLTWLWLDKFFSLRGVVEDVLGRFFISVGLLALFLMVPMTLTSTDKAIKRIGGARWRKIHKRIYLVGALGVLHYWLLVKADVTRPAIFAVVLVVLLGARVLHALEQRSTPGQPEAE
jgi:methionine sulfoxide reductase heme-binding subunit